MSRVLVLLFFLVPAISFAEQISLTIEDYDFGRQRASILVMDQTEVPLGTVLRVHSKTGTCNVKLTEKVNDHLIGITRGCGPGVIKPGMKLAYSTPNSWEAPVERAPAQEFRDDTSTVSTNYNSPDIIAEILDRTTVFIGHNFASELEGNVYSDGSVKDLDGDTALSIGIKGRVYDFTDKVSLSTELGYETPRTFDQATYTNNQGTTVLGTNGFSPRLSMWSLAIMGELKAMEKMNAFAGINFSIPSLSNSPFSMSGDLGFQGGANYQLLPNIALEGLIKITNMNLKNNIGQTTDVSLAGLELRGRYSF